MTAIGYLISTLIGLYVFIFILRAWFQYCRVDFYNPVSQTLVKLTQPLLIPLHKILPSKYNIDLAAIVCAFMIASLKLPILNLLVGQGLAINWGLSFVIGILSVVKSFGQIIFWAILIRAIMSWFSRGNNPMDYLLYQITEPLLAPLRRLLPNTGMIDFSVMLLGFILMFANYLGYDLFGGLWGFA